MSVMATTTRTTLSEREREALAAEIHACRQTQSWAPRSTRSRWLADLIDIADAADGNDPAALRDATAAADAQAVYLATAVAQGLAGDVNSLAYRLDLDGPFDTAADVVAAARATGVTVDNALQGDRDGFVIDADTAVAYATCRQWQDPELVDARWVEVDLLTGEVTVK